MATERIRATAETFLMTRGDGQAVVRFRLVNGEAVRAVGRLSDVQLGSECELVGRYQYHERFGRQFVVDSLSKVLPTSAVGIERFLASGLFKGVGPQTAHRIVQHFGVRTMQVLQETPEEVFAVPGLTQGRAQAVVSSFVQHQESARLATFLRGHDLPLHLVQKLVAQYGSGAAALRALQESPYQAAQDVRGIGFRTADGLARAVGVPPDSPDRLSAALLHVLHDSDEEGHMYLPLETWLSRAVALTSVVDAQVAMVAGTLAARGGAVYRHFKEQICVYSVRLDRVEQGIAEMVFEISRNEDSEPLADALDGEGQRFLEGLTAEQRAAAVCPLQHRLAILTGGPGTGKTTTLRAMVQIALQRKWKVALAAPTGRAAKRLADSTGLPAQTIHRLLEVGQQAPGGRFGFGRHRGRKLECDLLIVDETSMVDAPLFSSLLEAIPSAARIVLVGDPEQLPPVGPGQVLRDLIDADVARVFALQYVFRQERGSQITAAAHRVRAGLMPDQHSGREGDYFFIEEEDPKRAADLVVELATSRLPRFLDVDPVWGVQVLSPMRKGQCGVDRLNARLSEQLARKDGGALQSAGRTFRLGDKVINTKNDYDHDIYNGDMGQVTEVHEESLTVRFDLGDDERVVALPRAECTSLAHAYAISVHKSQGGEYPCVVLPLVREHSIMLTRPLVYTAMTRARKLLVLVGSKRALSWAVGRQQAGERFSGLTQRIETIRRKGEEIK